MATIRGRAASALLVESCHGSRGDNLGMCDMPEIDRERLAEMAAVAFHGQDVDDIPEKIWCDSYQGVVFLRATWGSGLTIRRVDMLEDLQQLVAAGYRCQVVAVAYLRDMDWREIDGLAGALQAVE